MSEFKTKFLVKEAKTSQFNPYRDSLNNDACVVSTIVEVRRKFIERLIANSQDLAKTEEPELQNEQEEIKTVPELY